MKILGWQIGKGAAPVPEARTASFTQADPNFLELIGLGAMASASGITVTVEKALSVPAIWAAVNFIPGTLAGLPLNLFERNGDERKRVTESPLAQLLHDAVNDEMSSFEWRKYTFERVLTGGRGLTFIERDGAGTVTNLWPLNPSQVKIKRMPAGLKIYEYSEPGRATVTYQAREIIDIPFMLKADGLGHMGPISANRDVIALAIAATEFGSKFFQNGGVPPFAVTGNFNSAGAMQRAALDLETAVRKASKEQRQALVLPTGLDIKPLGVDAEKAQLVELKKFLVEEVARIYSLPPTFLQDLSNGTFSNTEQQDLHFVKHTMKRWVEAFEQELNLKLFGRGDRKLFVEMNMDGLLRGDFKARMDGYAIGVQNGIMKPNEARQMENRPDDADGDLLMIQGATVPIRNNVALATGTGDVNGA
jgi:HK97 family phage portal protein